MYKKHPNVDSNNHKDQRRRTRPTIKAKISLFQGHIVHTIARHAMFILHSFNYCTSYDASIRNQSLCLTFLKNHLFCIDFKWDLNMDVTLCYFPYLASITKAILSAITTASYIVVKLYFNDLFLLFIVLLHSSVAI